MGSFKKMFGLFAIVLMMSGCGTISALQLESGNDPAKVRMYDKVVVGEFDVSAVDITTSSFEYKLNDASKVFANKLVNEIKRTGVFDQVERGEAGSDALYIDGEFIKFNDGNPSLRFWIGCGAGSSKLYIDVDFKDGLTSKQIASQKVKKHSWWLGGGLAASQTPEVLMDIAAKKIADDLAALKR